MASTTLVTFLLGHVHSTGSVDLLGSWDNFTTKYPMLKDRQKGHGHWFGTHTFKNILCDGDPTETLKPRDGGLKMGGTYWYYYIRDGHTEFHNPAETSTNNCPLLPGQTVNVLEIPIEPTLYSIKTSSELSLHLTMDPKDRFVAPKPRVRAKPSSCLIRSSDSKASSKRKRSQDLKLSDSSSLRPRSKARISNYPDRQDWFSQSIGRLQTAVVDVCLSIYAGHDLPLAGHSKDVESGGRRVKTALGKTKPVKAPPEQHRSVDLDPAPAPERPQSRFGLGLTLDALSQPQDHLNDDKFANPFTVEAEDLGVTPRTGLKGFDDLDLACSATRPQTWTLGLDSGSLRSSHRSDVDEVLAEQQKPANAPILLDYSSVGTSAAFLSPLDSASLALAFGAYPKSLSKDMPTSNVGNLSHEPRRSPPPPPLQVPDFCQIPLISPSPLIDWHDGLNRQDSNVTQHSLSSFWILAGSSSSTNVGEWSSPLLNNTVLDSPVSMVSQDWHTPPMEQPQRKSIDHNEVLAKLKEQFKRRSLGAGDFFDSQETIKPVGPSAGKQHMIPSGSFPMSPSLSQASTLPTTDTEQSQIADLGAQQDFMSDLSYLGAAIS